MKVTVTLPKSKAAPPTYTIKNLINMEVVRVGVRKVESGMRYYWHDGEQLHRLEISSRGNVYFTSFEAEGIEDMEDQPLDFIAASGTKIEFTI